MNDGKTKLHLIGCGGCGTNVVANIYHNLQELGDGFSDVTCSFIDTTSKTIQAYPEHEDKFFKITSTSASDPELDGCAGERKDHQNIAYMNASVRKYVDKGLSNRKNDYYVIISSAAGGTGSSTSVLLLRTMLEKDFTVITVTVGDSSNFLSLNNTINTLTSLQGVAIGAKKAVSNIYYSNTFNGVTSPKTEMDVNNKIFKMLSIISMFISGSIQNLDHQDMINFFRPDSYKSFRVAPGVYSLGIGSKVLNDENTIMTRTIVSNDGEDIDINIPLLHNKVGIVPDEIKDTLSSYPLFLLLRKDVLSIEVQYLKEEYEKIEKIKNKKYNEFDALDSADVDDEFGLAL